LVCSSESRGAVESDCFCSDASNAESLYHSSTVL
jgi:hypothetical protein